MDHVVYLDAKAKELEKLLQGTKSSIIRGAAGRKAPHGRVNAGDVLYFLNNNGEGAVKARAIVKEVFNSEKMTEEESTSLVKENEKKLNLSEAQFKRWMGKRYLVIIDVNNVEEIKPFEIDKSGFSNMDDWLLVEDIKKVKK